MTRRSCYDNNHFCQQKNQLNYLKFVKLLQQRISRFLTLLKLKPQTPLIQDSPCKCEILDFTLLMLKEYRTIFDLHDQMGEQQKEICDPRGI